jgi:hypothetical protein
MAGTRLPRRSFVARIGASVSLWFGAIVPAGMALPLPRLRHARRTQGSSAMSHADDVALLRALADAALPAELGPDGVARAATGFQEWMRGYRAGAELTHAYGTDRIDRTGLNPAPRWMTQLRALDTAARSAHAQGFDALDRAARQALVRTAVDAAATAGRGGRTLSANDIASGAVPRSAESLPGIAEAPHVAVAMLAFFYESPEANDLCYEAEIGRTQCRPLAAQSAKPVALRRAARGS